MKFTTAAATAALASLSVAAPTALTKRAAITDADILNYALTLEHLEATFYAQALQNYTQGESLFLTLCLVMAYLTRYSSICFGRLQRPILLRGSDSCLRRGYSRQLLDLCSYCRWCHPCRSLQLQLRVAEPHHHIVQDMC